MQANLSSRAKVLSKIIESVIISSFALNFYKVIKQPDTVELVQWLRSVLFISGGGTVSATARHLTQLVICSIENSRSIEQQ